MNDFTFKYQGHNVRISEEAWTDSDLLNKNRSKAEQIAAQKIKRGEVEDGCVVILTKDVRAFS